MNDVTRPCRGPDPDVVAERDWLLAQASDDVRETFFAVRDAERDRRHALEPGTDARDVWTCAPTCDRAHAVGPDHLPSCGYRPADPATSRLATTYVPRSGSGPAPRPAPLTASERRWARDYARTTPPLDAAVPRDAA
jgi:hypothetical protein